MIKSGKVENRQTPQVLASFFVAESNTKTTSKLPKSNVEGLDLICNSGRLPEDQSNFLKESPVICKQLNSTPKKDKLNEFPI